MTVDYRVGDTRDVIKGIADGSIDFVCTSPPFLALRSYVIYPGDLIAWFPMCTRPAVHRDCYVP